MRRVFRKHIFPHKLKRGLLTEASLFISLAVLYLMLLAILASLLYQASPCYSKQTSSSYDITFITLGHKLHEAYSII